MAGRIDIALEMSQEMTTPIELQRLWAKRLNGGIHVIDEPETGLLEDIFSPAQDDCVVPSKNHCCNPFSACYDDHWCLESEDDLEYCFDDDKEKIRTALCLDGARLGDIPARYTIPALNSYEFAVVGTWIDPGVVPGFRYKVTPIPEEGALKVPTPLFQGRSLTLESIGRGYSRRLTFEADENGLNSNDNYFWSDSHPNGFAFEIQVVSTGDKFTVHDVNHVPAGTLEVIKFEAPQEEVRHFVNDKGSIEKSIRVSALCKVEWFENGQLPSVLKIKGLVVAVKEKKESHAKVIRIENVVIGSHRRGYTLSPGVNCQWRRTIINGASFGDIPTQYTITGLKPYEIPVIGTYVDPRIVPGFFYKVRPSGAKNHLFGGRSLRLLGIGIGYGKRITFAPDSKQLNCSDNYFWSDSNPDGYGFEPRAVHEGMNFTIMSNGQKIGEAQVFRVDSAQHEEKQELISGPNGITVEKHIYVDVKCHVTLTSDCTQKEDSQVMRVSGTAIVTKSPKEPVAKLIRINNVGLDSHLNIIFSQDHSELTFYAIDNPGIVLNP